MQNQSVVSVIPRWIMNNRILTGIVVLSLLVLAPAVIGGSGLTMRVFSLIFINSLLAMGLMVITGYTGMLNMGHAAFYGIGAYTAAILALTFHQPFLICFLAATVGAGLAGFLIAFPCLRVTTDFLSLITIAFAEVFQTVILNWMEVTRGPMGLPGIPPIVIAGITFDSSIHYYYLFLFIAVMVFIALSNVMSSRVGRSLKAIRDDEICARAQGINVRYYKVLAFVLGTLPAGMAGAMIAFFVQFVGATMFKFEASLIMMNMVILGGLGSLPGAIIGAAFFVGFTELIRPLAVYRVGVGGAIMILLMLFRPQGLMGSKAFAGIGGFENMLIRWRQKLRTPEQDARVRK
jgi:branched-chain amino acid transport system permease protein